MRLLLNPTPVGGGGVNEKITLTLDASGVKTNSLAGLIKQLELVQTHIQKVDTALAGMKFTGPARSAKELEASLLKMQTTLAGTGGKGFTAGSLAKAVGADVQAFEGWLGRQKKAVEGYHRTIQEFRNLPSAARALASFERQMQLTPQGLLGKLLRPGVSTVTGKAAVSVAGQVALAIPGAQIQASVVGPVTVTIPGAQVVGAAAGVPARDPVTGHFVPGSGGGTGGGKGKGKGGKGSLSVPVQPGELSRVRTITDDVNRLAIQQVDALGQIITTTHDSIEGVLKTQVKTQSGRAGLAQFRAARSQLDQQFKQVRALLDPKDSEGIAGAMEKHAAQVRALTQGRFMSAIPAPQRAELRTLIEERAKTIEAMAMGTRGAAASRARTATELRAEAMADLARRGPSQQFIEQQAAIAASDAAHNEARRKAESDPRVQRAIAKSMSRDPVGAAADRARRGGSQSAIDYQAALAMADVKINKDLNTPRKPEPPGRFARGLAGFSPMGFLGNLATVTAWGAAVETMYKAVQLAEYSIKRLITIGEQTAHLSTVFKGVGGSAKDLTDDVMSLAAAQGKSTDEAMASAVEWARLGLTRKQINEAVRVSMVADNIAQMNLGETTKQLASLMHVYNLEVGDLSGVLGMLVQTSLSYNVTLEDLFTGLDRSAGAARQAGVGLAELQAMIATVVGKTGQSGIIVGNTIKSLLVQFANPGIQRAMRSLGIEPLTNTLEQKPGTQIMREMAEKWQTMTPREQLGLTKDLVGRLGAARFRPLMEDYLHTQRLAIESQLNLNAAEAANLKILDTLKAQLAGVRSEFDRLIVSQGNAGSPSLMQQMTQIAGGVRTGLGLANRSGMGIDVINPFAWAGRLLRGVAARDPNSREGKYLGMNALFMEESAKNFGIFGGLPETMKRFTELFKTPEERRSETREQRRQQFRSQAAGYATQAGYFESAGRILPHLKPDDIEATAGMMGERGAAFRSAMQSGDRAQAGNLLQQAARAARERSVNELRKENLETVAFTKSLERQREAQRQIIAQNLENPQGDAYKKASEEVFRLTGLINNATNAQTDLNHAIEDQEGVTPEVLERMQQYLDVVRQVEMVTGAMSQLSKARSLDTVESQRLNEITALRAELALLKTDEERLRAEHRTEATNQANELLNREIIPRTSRLRGLESDRYTSVARWMDDENIARRRASLEGEGFGVGITETERLMTQRRGLENRVSGLQSAAERRELTHNEGAQLIESQNQLYHVQTRLIERLVSLDQQRRQIQMESAREFNKSLLFAGPGELLTRLFVARTAQRGPTSLNEFMAMTPEARRMLYEYRGGEAGARVREEQSLGRQDAQRRWQQSVRDYQAGHGSLDAVRSAYSAVRRNGVPSVEEQQELARRSAQGIGNTNEMLTRQQQRNLPAASPMDQQAQRSAASLGALTAATNLLTGAFASLRGLIANLGGGRAASPSVGNTPGPTTALSAGHALGSGGSPVALPERRTGGWRTDDTGMIEGTGYFPNQFNEAVMMEMAVRGMGGPWLRAY